MLAKIEIPASVNYIGGSAFAECSLLRLVKIPRKTISIGIDAFEGCTKLETIVGGEQLRPIGTLAFEGCISLRNVCIDADRSKLTIDKRAFEGCNVLDVSKIFTNTKELSNKI